VDWILRFGVLVFWRFGVLAFWRFGVLEFWSFGVLAFWLWNFADSSSRFFSPNITPVAPSS
jgi:hypothetical protein